MSDSGGKDAAATIARLEAELRAWEQLASSSPDIISRIDAEGVVTYVSPSVRKVLGYDPAELVGQRAHGFLEPSEQAERYAGFERRLKDGNNTVVVTRARRKDGAYVWMEYRTEAVRDADGKVIGFHSISHDVTTRQQAQEALERSERNFEAFVRAMPVPALIRQGPTCVLVNRAFTAAFGYEEEAFVGRSILDFIEPADRSYIAGRLRTSMEIIAGVPTREHHVLHADGTSVAVEVTALPVVFRGTFCSLAVFSDLRERKRLEAQLITAERMASLGRLAAAVGHEINNPLAYMLGSLALVDRELADPPGAVRELLAHIREGAERIRTVVSDLRAFSRESETLGLVDLDRVLHLSASMADHEVRHHARLVKDWGELPQIAGSEARLGQVFLNLLVNAAQAIPRGDPDKNEVRIEARATGDGSVVVDVVDTGSGVDPAIAEHIFEPFFTTKPGEGTGLGLSISYHIVTSLGGSLSLVPGSSRGARFRVVLPCGDGTSQVPPRA